MLEEHAHLSGVARARQRATRERARAARAAGVASRHELLAQQGSPELRQMHRGMAEMHRDIERRHLASARLHADHADRLFRAGDAVPAPPFLAAVAEEIGAAHVGVSLVLGDRTDAVTIASDAITSAVQDQEAIIGEGPVHDVAAYGDPIVADQATFWARWPRFAPAAARYGVRSVAAEPLRTDTGCLGVLTVLDPPAEPGPVPLATVADALVHSALLAPESIDPLDVPLLDAGADDHAVLHQASGMVAEQLGCEVADGLVVLRARAFTTDTPLGAIAAEVVRRGWRVN